MLDFVSAFIRITKKLVFIKKTCITRTQSLKSGACCDLTEASNLTGYILLNNFTDLSTFLLKNKDGTEFFTSCLQKVHSGEFDVMRFGILELQNRVT